jgi:group II intron reverse transcriptase/maturase
MIVDETQEKLAVWAQDPDHRFFDIYHLVYDEDWLYRAFLSVKSNSGSGTAGVDEETVEDFGENLQKNLKDLRKSLKSESYTPSPVRRTYIPKGDGRKRPLGIPTIRDRIVQEALRMILEPIYETDFSGSSYGFRPNRSTHDALTSVYQRLTPASPSYMPWVIDADIEGFFDNVDHRTLEQIIQDRIEDQKIRDLVWKFLKAGYVEDGETHQTILGTPQGGIISPLLANVYLNELDQWVKQWTDTSNNEKEKRRKRGKGNWQYVRYADDFLLMTNGKKGRAEWMMEKVGSFVSEELNLMLSDKKSELRHAEDGLSFLGYELKAKTDTGGVKRKVPIDAINRCNQGYQIENPGRYGRSS